MKNLNVLLEGESLAMVNSYLREGYYDNVSEMIKDALKKLGESMAREKKTYLLDECDVVLELREEWSKLSIEEQKQIRADLHADLGITDDSKY